MDAEPQELYNNQIDLEYIYNKLIDLEDRSRRYSIRIDSVAERKGETWEQCKDEVQTVIKEKLGLENIAKEEVHRSKVKNSSSKPRTIVYKLLPYTQKMEILKNVKELKNSVTFVKWAFLFWNSPPQERTLEGYETFEK